MTTIREIAEKYTSCGRDRCDIDVLTLALREFGEELAKIADAECEKLTAAKNAEGNTELGRKFQHSVWTAFAIAERIRAAIRESL